GVGTFDGLEDGQGVFRVSNRFVVAVQGNEAEGQVKGGVTLAAAVADLPGDHQLLPVEADGGAGVPEVLVSDPQVAQGRPLAAAVADLPGDHQLLPAEADGGAGVAEVGVGVPQVAQGGTLA